MKESQKRIRLQLASNAISILLEADKPLARKDLFIPLTGKDDEIKEVLSKKWQVDFLNSLVEDKILDKTNDNSQVRYSVLDRMTMSRILSDNKNFGLKLSGYIFPTEVVSVGSKHTNDESVSRDSEPTKPPYSPNSSDESSSHVSDDIVVATLRKLISVIGEGQNGFMAYFQKINTKLVDLSNVVSKIEDESKSDFITKEIHGLIKRVEKLEDTVKGQHRLIEANHKIMKDSAAAFEKVAESAINLTTLEKVLSESDSRTRALQQSVNSLVQVYRSAEEDKIRKLILRIESHINESNDLKDLILTTLAERKA
jgi:hypothetical protein